MDLEDNAKMLIDQIFEEYPDRNERAATMLINNFCKNMQTSARQAGKYAILIILGDAIFICHADSKEMTITKEADVMERLLDTDNVDKYAEFRNREDGIEVRHFERHRTKSLSGWLGVAPSKISYGDAGKVKVFTEIDEVTCSFQFTQDEFAEHFIQNSKYEIVNETLRTPSGNEYHIEEVKYGKRTFDDPDEFKQDFYGIYYDVESYREHYENIANSMEPFTSTIIDGENQLTEGRNGRSLLLKEHDEFDITFASGPINLRSRWRSKLIRRFENDTRTLLFHAGAPFSEDEIVIGPYELYNDLDLPYSSELNSLYSIIREGGTGQNMTNIISYVIFKVLSAWAQRPVGGFFEQLSEKYADRLDEQGLILKDEDEVLEFKDRNWLASKSDDKIAEKFTKEIQADTRLVIVGIDEADQCISPVKRSRYSPERNERIENKVQDLNGNHDSISLKSIPLGDGNCLLFAFSIRGGSVSNAGLDML
jgi:hypothetical protein